MVKNILIVEDDFILSMVLVRMVEKLGFSVLDECNTGQSAVDSVKKNKPDLILMDIQLKNNLDGVMAMQKIREFSDVPVIYITGNSDQENIERAKETDYIDYLVKPVQVDDLKRVLEKASSNR